jgi:hypothetical protein
MECSTVENLSGLQESIFNLSRGPQLHFGEKSKKWSNFIKFTDFPPFPLFGVPWAAVIFISRKSQKHSLEVFFVFWGACLGEVFSAASGTGPGYKGAAPMPPTHGGQRGK